jgi:iron complex outermembrane receptor protein
MHVPSYRKLLTGSVFGATAAALFASAAAQTAPPSPPLAPNKPVASSGLETITVTARKKSEALQKVPLSITAIGKKDLKQLHVQNLFDIVALTPGISNVDIGAEVGTSITIRGVTDLTFGSNVPDVATFLDGVYLREPAAINLAGASLSQVEVLKGPVSALYGRDAYSGVINYVTDRPTATPHADLEWTVGNYGKEELVGSVSGPIWQDRVFGKVFGTYDSFDGTYTDKVSGATGGGYEKKDFGGLLDVKWADVLSTHIDGYYGYDYFGNTATEALTPNCGPIATETAQQTFVTSDSLYCGRIKPGNTVDIGNDPQAGNPGNERRVFFGSMRNTATFDWGKIDSITGATKIDEQAFQIFDASSLGRPYLLATGTSPKAPPNGGSVLEHEFYGSGNQTSNFSEELRYSSPQDQRLRFGFGGYYYRERRVQISAAALEDQGVPAGQELWSNFGAFGIPLSIWETPTGAVGSNINVAHQLTDEASGFANAELDILPNLTVASEYRYTDMLQQFVAVRNQYDGAEIDPLGSHISQTNQYFNTNESIRWLPMPNATLYFAFANGTKPGGFNGASTVVADEAFGPETDTSYEGGAKTSWLQNRLQVNLAVYHIDTANVQSYGPSSDPKNAATVIKNFGMSSNTGFEVDTRAKPRDDVSLSFGFNYNDPTFNNGSFDLSDTSYCALIPSCLKTEVLHGVHEEIPIGGNAVPFSPKITLSASAEYDFSVLDAYKGFARFIYSYKTAEFTNAAELNSIGPASNLDFYTGISRGRYSLSAYVKNITDNRTPVDFDYQVQLEYFQNVPIVILPPGRTFAFTFGVHFGGAPEAMPPASTPEVTPMAAPEVAPARTYLVFFDWDRADLTARARQILASAASASTHVQTTRIEVSGYTDLSGTAAYNQRLSVRRAQSVQSELVRDGVPAGEISIHGYGESNPLVPTAKGVREPQNRRVEIVLR